MNYLLGVDAGTEIINKAKNKNNFPNVEYMVFDALRGDWRTISKRFHKAIIYSVIHFFDSIEDVEKLLTELLKVMERECIILIGDVRDKDLYTKFMENQRTKKITLRDIKFQISKILNSFYLNHGKIKKVSSIPCSIFSYNEIKNIADKLGLECLRHCQSKKHPFYNTTVDYILTRKE